MGEQRDEPSSSEPSNIEPESQVVDSKPDPIFIDNSEIGLESTASSVEREIEVQNTNNPSTRSNSNKEPKPSRSKKLSHICIFEDCTKGKKNRTDYCKGHQQITPQVIETNPSERLQKGLIGFSLCVFAALLSIIFENDTTCCFSIIIFVLGWAVILQSFTTTSKLKFSESLGYVLVAVFFIAIMALGILGSIIVGF